MPDIDERLRSGDPLNGALPPARPMPSGIASNTSRPPRRRIWIPAAAAVATAAMALGVFVAITAGDGSAPNASPGSAPGAPETVEPVGQDTQPRTAPSSSVPPPFPSEPPAAVPPTGPRVAVVPLGSRVRGSLRLPTDPARDARLRLRGLTERDGGEYGLWLRGAERRGRFLGLIPRSTPDTANLTFPLPRRWMSYQTIIVATQRDRSSLSRPGRSVARAKLP